MIDVEQSFPEAPIQKITAGGLPLDELLVAANGLEPDQARQLYQVWISFNKEHPLLFIARFRLHAAPADRRRAGRRGRTEGRTRDQAHFAPACINLGSAYERRGMAKEAVEQWRDGVERMSTVSGDAINYKTTLLKQISRVLSDNQEALAAAEIALTQCLDLAPDARDVAEQYVASRLSQCKWPMTPVGSKISRRTLVSRLHPLSLCAYTDDPLFQLAASERYVRTMAPIEDRITRYDRRLCADRRRISAACASVMSAPTCATTQSAI